MLERLVARAMDSVRAIREESQDVGALVTCGFFYIVGTTRNQTAQVISVSHLQSPEIDRTAGLPLEHFRCARCGGSSINQVGPPTAPYENATADGSYSSHWRRHHALQPMHER